MDTPALVIDLAVVDRNINQFQSLAKAAGLKTRPHIKTHKISVFAGKQIAAGAIGVTCQKIGEAEVMADGGITDIMITFNIVGPGKLARLVALARRCKLSVSCDSVAVARGLSESFASEAAPLAVLVECDTGAGRCGVQTPEDARNLAQRIASLPGLTFGGLMTYPPMTNASAVNEWLTCARDLCHDARLGCDVISTGGTPNLTDLVAFTVATEHRAGTYIYNDRSLVMRGACAIEDCAAVVMGSVVSRPTDTRAILDTGSKALSSDLLGMKDYGLIREAPDAVVSALSEEHGIVDLSKTRWRPEIGDVVSIIPNHVCVVSNLFPTVLLRTAGGEMAEQAVDARGKLR